MQLSPTLEIIVLLKSPKQLPTLPLLPSVWCKRILCVVHDTQIVVLGSQGVDIFPDIEVVLDEVGYISPIH